jgi:putative transcriptional regulator
MPLQYTLRRSQPATFPNTIREYRLRAGLSQRKLAAMIGRSRSVVARWERGEALPPVPLLFRLAKTLNTLAETLYADLYSPKGTESINALPA